MHQVPGKYCTICGQVIEASASVCPYCHAQQVPPPPPQQMVPQQPSPRQMIPQQGVTEYMEPSYHPPSRQMPTQYMEPNYHAPPQHAMQPQHTVHHHYGGGTKNRMIAVLLAFFLGMFGAHKFYLNQNAMGVLYFLGTVTCVFSCIPWVISIVEAINYLLMTDRQFERSYGDW